MKIGNSGSPQSRRGLKGIFLFVHAATGIGYTLTLPLPSGPVSGVRSWFDTCLMRKLWQAGLTIIGKTFRPALVKACPDRVEACPELVEACPERGPLGSDVEGGGEGGMQGRLSGFCLFVQGLPNFLCQARKGKGLFEEVDAGCKHPVADNRIVCIAGSEKHFEIRSQDF